MMGESPAIAVSALPPSGFTRRSSAPAPPLTNGMTNGLSNDADDGNGLEHLRDATPVAHGPALINGEASPISTPPAPEPPPTSTSLETEFTPERRQLSAVDAAIAATNGPPGAPLSGVLALVLVTILGPFGGAFWLSLVRHDLRVYLRRNVAFASIAVPFLSFLTLGIVGALWRVLVLAPLVEELQTRAELPTPSVNRLHYALPFVHTLFVQEDLATAWIATARRPG